MNPLRPFFKLFRLLSGDPESQTPHAPDDGARTIASNDPTEQSRLLAEIDDILTDAANHAPEADADWITALRAKFDDLPLLPAIALLHYINPNDAKAKIVDRLISADFDPYTRSLFSKWNGSRIEAGHLHLAMAVEYHGSRHGLPEYSVIADAIRLISLNNLDIGRDTETDDAVYPLASCATDIARALVRDSRALFGRSDLNGELLTNLAFLCRGWRSMSANMLRFRGPRRSFNHIAFGIGHDLLRRPSDILQFQRSLPDPHPYGGPESQADANGHSADANDIPSEFDGVFEDPIVEEPHMLDMVPDDFEPDLAPTDAEATNSGNTDVDDPSPSPSWWPTSEILDTSPLRNAKPDLPPAPHVKKQSPPEKTGDRPSLLVCDLKTDNKDRRSSEIVAAHRHVIGTPVPLVPTPDLVSARRRMVAEFPYAVEAIDLVLNDLVGRPTLKLEPLVLFGSPGAGKSRFARRLAAILGMPIVRTDASRSDGNVFGGTDRRWYSAEPCHPFLAISRTRAANPLMLIDEVEKAAVRTDYGRLWDCMLGFLEVETACCYPDPALQTDIDLSAISYVFTANDLDNLPHALRDRLRIVEFPEPKAEHLEALLKPVFDDYLKTRNIDQAWAPPLSQMECEAIAQRWKGGSVRKLSRLMIGVMRAREKTIVRH